MLGSIYTAWHPSSTEVL